MEEGGGPSKSRKGAVGRVCRNRILSSLSGGCPDAPVTIFIYPGAFVRLASGSGPAREFIFPEEVRAVSGACGCPEN